MSDGSPGARVLPTSRQDFDDDEEEEEEEEDEEEEEAVVRQAVPLGDDSDSDDGEEEEDDEDGEDGEDGENGEEVNEAGSNGDEGNEPVDVRSTGDNDDDEERQISSGTTGRSGFTVATIKQDYFLTYGKKTFGVEEDVFVIIGTPFPCENGEEMGHILASKSPDEWEKIKSKHIYLLTANGLDFMYVCFYVPGSDAEDLDKIRLQPVHRPVCKGLVEKFNSSNIKDERRKEIARIMNFTCPPEDAGPQIDPRAQQYPRYQIEAGAVPTAKRARVSKPRALKNKCTRDGRPTSPAPKPEKVKSTPLAEFMQKSAKSLAKKKATAAPPLPAPPVAPKPKADGKKRIVESPRDDGSNASTQAVASASNERQSSASPGDMNEWCVANTPFKRLRTLQVADAAKTHIYMMGNVVHIEEH